MPELNLDPAAVAGQPLGDDAGGNTEQPDDGRDAEGRLPLPADASGVVEERPPAGRGARGLAAAKSPKAE